MGIVVENEHDYPETFALSNAPLNVPLVVEAVSCPGSYTKPGDIVVVLSNKDHKRYLLIDRKPALHVPRNYDVELAYPKSKTVVKFVS